MVRDKIKQIIKDIDTMLFGWKVSWEFNAMCRESARKERKYCKNGWHKLSTKSWKSTNHKGQTLSVSFIQCRYCGTAFFRSPKDKKTYLRIKDQQADSIRKHIELMLGGVKVKVKRSKKVKEFK